MEHNIVACISKKRDKGEWSKSEIEYIIKSIVNNHAAQEQVGAMLMAVYLNGLTVSETCYMTQAMMSSGEVLDWPIKYRGLVVDKHSTGGVGDKASIPLVPILADLGLKVPMVSGRGLGITGGTLDKLESIPGFNVNLTVDQIHDCIEQVGGCIVGQTMKLVPADKILYATRDVTATVGSIPLIVGSIISKKAAESLDVLAMEVTFGKGAFMKHESHARELAQSMLDLGKGLNMQTVALLTNMDNPIGRTIGNSVEIVESIQFLQGNCSSNSLEELVYALGSQLLVQSGKAQNVNDAESMMKQSVASGRALQLFSKMLQLQGVAKDIAEKLITPQTDLYSILPKANYSTTIRASTSGFVQGIDSLACGEVLHQLGAGRTLPTDTVDHGVGLYLHRQPGEYIYAGDIWAELYHSTPELPTSAFDKLYRALELTDNQPSADSLTIIKKVMT